MISRMRPDPLAIDVAAPPFDQFTHVHWLAAARSGHESYAHARHQLYVGRPRRNPVDVLIKVVSKPGLVYEQDIANEIASLSTINQALPDSPYFPAIQEHGRLDDGRVYVIMSLFDEFPLMSSLGERDPHRLVGHLRTTIAVARALADIHRLQIFHVDLNPMNILHRTEKGQPVIRIVDFESSYERARHGAGSFYSPPTTPGYSAPEVARQPPDARSDLFSLGAVLYTLIAGYQWSGQSLAARIGDDPDLDAELKASLLTASDPDPKNRYASADEFRAALAAYLEGIWPGR
jgi:serine/threonine protein kinase